MNAKEKTDIQEAIESAVTPLRESIEALTKRLDDIVSKLPKPPEPTEEIKASMAVLNSIPKDILASLKVGHAHFDPNKKWFGLVLVDGRHVSIKINDSDFRVRLRDQAGELLKELNPSMNGLAGALKSLVEV